ncbi:MAG: V-type ATP synthase subunit K [Planctomycetes bacterium]|nr:V-type ATP synthase subunit K [Planctomycetota bacterium]MCD7895798.1 V-type ATP synthase subunit K [Planctomycetaceae bacterium]
MLTFYFLESGIGWTVLGAMTALVLGGMGSALGISIAAGQGAGVLSEKPNLFGKVFLLILLPGTQGLYGMVFAFLVTSFTGIQSSLVAAQQMPVGIGVALGIVGFCLGLVLLLSAKYQGQTSAAAINLVAKKEDQFGRGIILPALVETYAVFGLLVAILMLNWLLVDGVSRVAA